MGWIEGMVGGEGKTTGMAGIIVRDCGGWMRPYKWFPLPPPVSCDNSYSSFRALDLAGCDGLIILPIRISTIGIMVPM